MDQRLYEALQRNPIIAAVRDDGGLEACLHFTACPHCEAIRELGATPEEIKCFCRNMIGACDYAIVHPFTHCKIEFPTTVADGEGEPCRMTITYVDKK